MSDEIPNSISFNFHLLHCVILYFSFNFSSCVISCCIPGFDRLPPGTSPLEAQHWADLQRRYASMGALHPGHPGSGNPTPGSSHIPGVYPPNNLSSDLIRERERLDRMGKSSFYFYLSIAIYFLSCCPRIIDCNLTLMLLVANLAYSK